MNDLTKEQLYDYYITQNMRVQEIADIIGLHKSAVERRLKKYGIKKDQKLAKQLARATNLKKYGFTTATQSPLIKQKTIDSNIKKYGKAHWMQLDGKKKQRKKTNLKKYGVEHVMQNEAIKSKVKETNLERYGNECSLYGKDIRKKTISTNLDRYGVENPMQHPAIVEKFKKSFMDKYGADNPLKVKSIIDKGLRTKVKNGNMTIICGMDVDQMSLQYNVSPNFIRKNIRELSSTEEEFISFLETSKENHLNSLEYKMSKALNTPFYNKKIPNTSLRYKPDFKLTDKIYLNVDGLYWHSEVVKKDKKYHFNMRKEFEESGMRILQFREDEVLNKLPIITSMINNILGKSNRIYGRNTTIEKIKQPEANEFLNRCHIMGTMKAKHIGLFSENKLTMLMSYKVVKGNLKIERLCSELGVTIVGGFSKLLKNLNDNLEFNDIYYWVDLRYGTGTFLEGQDFDLSRETLGWKWTDFISTHNRLICKANMDDRGLREREHAKELGIHKIYDAGQRVYMRQDHV